jgi:hypothetical protein
MRFLFLFGITICFSLMSIGCCGPMGCGPGCGISTGCNDCDGLAGNQQIIPSGPIDQLRQLKRQVVCGGGCGEVYVGEWISTPPDSVDPCQGNCWVGGATQCQPFCWERGTLARGLFGGLFNGLMGHRFCTGAESSAPCGCGMCDGGHIESGFVDSGIVGGCSTGNCSTAVGGFNPSCRTGNCGMSGTCSGGCSTGTCATSTSGCATGHCASNVQAGGLRMANRQMGEVMSARAMDARVDRIRR